MTLTGERLTGNHELVRQPAYEREPVMRRVAPAFALFLLAPLVAEYLLGDFPITYLGALVLLAPMYGGGAILIREVVRRTGRGWPSIVALALAYGVFEEGITTQSLFDPNYAHAHLLDKGFIPALGIAVPWTLFVLTLHTVWSISVPIALVEGLVPGRRTTPWLRAPGLIVATVLFVVGAVATLAVSYASDHFLAPWPTLAVVLLIVAALVVTALRLPRASAPTAEAPTTAKRAPAAWTVLALTLAAGAVFMLGSDTVPTWPAVALVSAEYVAVVWAVLTWSRRPGWDDRHRLALAAGALLTYAWHAFTMRPVVGDGPVITPVSHAVFALVALALVAVELRRLPKRAGTGRAGTERPEVTGKPADLESSARGSLDMPRV
jgi:hypothetical protein